MHTLDGSQISFPLFKEGKTLYRVAPQSGSKREESDLGTFLPLPSLYSTPPEHEHTARKKETNMTSAKNNRTDERLVLLSGQLERSSYFIFLELLISSPRTPCFMGRGEGKYWEKFRQVITVTEYCSVLFYLAQFVFRPACITWVPQTRGQWAQKWKTVYALQDSLRRILVTSAVGWCYK